MGRGLRRMDYSNFDNQGRFKPEYVDVYGIPFSVIPFKGRPVKHKEDEDKPVNHVHALPERAPVMEMRFPVVEGYVFALRKNLIRCDVDAMEATTIEPDRTPTATFVAPAVGYRTGMRRKAAASGSSNTTGTPITPARICRRSNSRLRNALLPRSRNIPLTARISSGACCACNRVTNYFRRSIAMSKITSAVA